MGIDQKYGRVTTERGRFHEDEPLFILRAQDPLARMVILSYLVICNGAGCSVAHLDSIKLACDKFLDWQKMNPHLVKKRPGERAITPEIADALKAATDGELVELPLNNPCCLEKQVDSVEGSE